MLWLHYRQAKAEPVDVARAVHSPPVSSIFSFSWTWFVLGAAESEPSSGFVILKSLLKNESFQKRLPHRRRPQVVLGNVVLYLRSSIWPFFVSKFSAKSLLSSPARIQNKPLFWSFDKRICAQESCPIKKNILIAHFLETYKLTIYTLNRWK